ncbi:MarR family winged helix-turn-helix transcriptional regulator [Microvirga pudoricolor]|uniref:MarR family winged helix-turn-helix transcriptional regulator n=1 Tax=Microvirga pudoricolor TaxID=2778729 RepID=UPI00194FFFFA|nr:MarR family transcriptional regulator [Microvirga pudoricolor]MBM6592441.1 MarR family transcriptional regulator [Microvirga pudoricolor]
MTAKNPAQALDNQLCFTVYSMAHAFNRAYRTILAPFDLTYPQYLVLIVLWAEDGLSVREIGAKLFLDSGTLTPLLKRLEAQGYVRRARDKADERQVRISLTDEGRALQERASGVPQEIGCTLGMAGDEYRALLGQLADLRGRLQAYEPQAIQEDEPG